jgi:hypothetical protein
MRKERGNRKTRNGGEREKGMVMDDDKREKMRGNTWAKEVFLKKFFMHP